MEGSREFRGLALAIVVLCLVGALHAQSGRHTADSRTSHTYAIPLAGHCSEAHKAEATASYPASRTAPGWEVSVKINPAQCTLYCTYRRKHDLGFPSGMLDQALPPIATIHIYSENGPMAPIVIFDPAGLEFPEIKASQVFRPPEVGTSPRKFFAPENSDGFNLLEEQGQVQLVASQLEPRRPHAAPVPLRI